MKHAWFRTSLWPLAASSSLLAACSFSADTPNINDDAGDLLPPDADTDVPDADPNAPDADPNTPDAAPPDAAPVDAEPDATPCDFDDQDICDTGEPDGPLLIDAETTFNTDNDPLCRTLAQAGGPEACLVVVESFTLNGGIAFTGIGSRPLIIASAGDININGLIDVSSRISGQLGAGANFADCAVTTAPEGDVGGSGGGAGGSFAGTGGNGGDGDEDESSGGDGVGTGGTAGAAVPQPTFLRGGCPGGAGAEQNDTDLTPPGNGGGAIRLHTPANINLNGGSAIRATGAGGQGGVGGNHAGGGGGGTGGHVILEATNINLGGNVGANGGGGGEGGVNFQGNSNDVNGNDGQDGQLSATGATGGSGASQFGGNGGDGSSQADPNGENGSGDDGAGGGGGGAAGFIIFRGTVNDNGGQVSPPAIVE